MEKDQEHKEGSGTWDLRERERGERETCTFERKGKMSNGGLTG